MQFTQADILRFADWSRDRNPLHVDPVHARETHFGGTLVHGMLTVIETLAASAPRGARAALDIEFRGAVVPGRSYEPDASVEGDTVRHTLRAGDTVVLTLLESAGFGDAVRPDLSWVTAVAARPAALRTSPAARPFDELLRGVHVDGVYAVVAAPVETPAWSSLPVLQAHVLMLASYVVGMEAPGLTSLFTRATVHFHDVDVPASTLVYRVSTVRLDPQFRLLDLDLIVATPEGTLVATARLRSYVPFSPVVSNVEVIARRAASLPSLAGKVALVCGASRGLGADVAHALASAGCHVYAASRAGLTPRSDAAGPGRIETVAGDVGDASWCRDAAARIAAAHGGLDLLVLNACAPPDVQRVGTDGLERHEAYVRDNLRLVLTPLAACLPVLSAREGCAVYVSSSYVEHPVAGLSAYIALKQAAEGLVATVIREHPALSGLVLRPPPLQTRWNDTPTGAAGAIPADWIASRMLERVSRGWTPGTIETVSEFPEYPIETEPSLTRTAPADFSVRIAATFTADPVLPGLRFWMQELGVDTELRLAPYGQVLQALLDPSSVLAERGKALNVVLLRVRDWLRELGDDTVGDLDALRSYLEGTARDFERAMRTHRASGAPETLLLLCPSYESADSAENVLLQQVEIDLLQSLGGLPGLQIARALDYHEAYGVSDADVADPLRDHIAHIPYRDAYLHVLAAVTARHAYRKLALARKVVVVDCDNTLWGGVVGEVGAEGVEFDAGHRALHRTLVRLSENGVLICLCSKNEEPDVWRVFETRPELGLPRETVVAATINWQLKSQNIRTLAARLNLGLDSFVFLDDNPVECAEVRAGCPEVLTIEWPREPDRAERLLQHVWEFDRTGGTKEDQRRTQMYREEVQRQEARADTLTFEDFIKNLQLVVDASPLAPEDVKRASQLTLRTNQFNFTTIRRDEAELQAVASDGHHDVRTIRVRDRFGDYGLVGLVIAERGGDAWSLDTFLLSCRVLGRGVEHQILADLGEMAHAAGATHVRLRVEFTKRNTPARTFLESAIPGEYRQADEHALVCEVPSDVLRHVRFEPSSSSGEVIAEEGDGKAAAPVDAARVRRRESQIARTAFELADIEQLRQAIEGRGAPSSDAVAPDDEDVAAAVHEAFATALRVPVTTVTTIDALEKLGCDSMRVVEITVALSERFPWLPSTLLFEFRTVSEIVAEIGDIAATRRGGAVLPKSGGAARAQEPSPSGDIAVVGMHIRCAGASTIDQLWDLLKTGRSAVKPVPADRDAFLQPLSDTRPHWAGLLDDVSRFDAELFGVSPREAEVMDPQLRLFLEVAWGALEDAGATGPDHQTGTGVFVGVMYGDYGYRANDHDRVDSPYRCWEGFSLANRLSQLLGFQGPSFAVETACSSSATAVHLACTALRAGECRTAVVGGVNLILDPDRFGSLGRLGILSPDGRCEPFGADANGTVLGEGAGVVVLRPLADAQARGDRIYGVIKGTALSTGNGTVGFTAPNPQAQAEAVRRSLLAARLDPRTVSYVETHGTGTALGDPIEVRGLTLAFGDPALWDPRIVGDQRCALGSVKPNIGHLEAGAGVVGLIKVLLQLHRGELLPSLTSREPSPHIPFGETPFVVQRTLDTWRRPTVLVDGAPIEVPRRAGLNSFGVGGANAHLIVEEAPRRSAPERERRTDRPLHVLSLSSRTPDGLARTAADVAVWLRNSDASLADVAFSLNTGRRAFEHRCGIVGRDGADIVRGLDALVAGTQPPGVFSGGGRASGSARVAFLFTGQGSQYAGMGRELYESHPVFADALDRCAAIVDRRLDRRLTDLLFAADGSEDAALLNQTGYTQPALFAFEYALAQLWMSWGVVPDVVLGHSVGEITAMCVAGVMSLEDGLSLIAARGGLMQALPPGGAMASVMAGEAVVREALAGHEDDVSIAALNALGQTVIAGVGSVVEAITARLGESGVKSKALTVSHAFHSPLMRPMLDEYARVVAGLRFSTPRIPVVSCVTGGIVREEGNDPEYWRRQVADPVRFMDAMRALEHERVTTCVEIGPAPVLLGLGRQCVADDAGMQWVPSLRRDADPWSTLLGGVAKVFVEGTAIDWKAFDAPFTRQRVPVPVSALGGRRYWLKGVRDSAPSRTATVDRAAGMQAYRVSWHEIPSTTERGAWPPSTCIVFVDDDGAGAPLVDALRLRGVRVIDVRKGQTPAQLDHDRYEVRAHHEADLRDLYDRIGPVAAPVRIVDFWTLDDTRDEADDIERVVLRSLAHAAGQVRALAASEKPASVWFVTRGAVAVGSDEAGLVVSQAPLWGFVRSAALEFPELVGGVVDLDRAAAPGDVERLLDVVLGGGEEDQVAIRGAALHAPRLVVAELPAAVTTLSATGTYLVTGGTGALGLHAAGWLVDKGARQLVLASRHATLGPAAAAAVASLEARGAAVRIEALDVARHDAVDQLLNQIDRGPAPLRGVVHAAGVDVVAGLPVCTDDVMRQVLAPKVSGTWHLHEATRGRALDLFVSFSSMAAIVGAQGRAHYAAANVFLDAVGTIRQRDGLPATTVNWGPWKDGGMAGADHLQQFERVGNHGLVPARALEALDRLAGAGDTGVMVADVDWSRFAPVYEGRRRRPLIEQFSSSAVAVAVTSPALPAVEDQRSDWGLRLGAIEPAHRLAEVTGLLRQAVAETLGFDDAERVPTDRSFYEIGMDSLAMADLVSRLSRAARVASSALVFDHPSVDQLAPRLLEVIPTAVPAPAAAAVPATRGADEIERAVREEILATLGFDETHALRADQSFPEMGLDSLTAAELAGRLRRRVGLTDASAIFAYPTVRALVTHLAGQLVTVAAGAPSSIEARVSPPSEPVVSGYDPSREDEIIAFQAVAFPDRQGPRMGDRWRWMFLESARRLGVSPRVWVYRDGGRIVGQQGSIPVAVKIGGTVRPMGWLVDTMVLAAYRERAVGTRLLVQAHQDQPLSLSLGQTAEAREICRRLGWAQVAPLRTAMLPVNPERVLRGKLPTAAAWAAGLGLRATATVRDLLRPRAGALTTRQVERFDARHDALWQGASGDLVCAVVRDASYLNWKYVDRPGQSFLCLDAYDGTDLVGTAVWLFREPDGIYQYRRAFLVDVVAPAHRMNDVVRAVSGVASRQTDALVCLHIGQSLSAALAANGYHSREPGRFLLVDPAALSPEEQRLLLDESSWFVTQGDSDIDRP